MKHKWLPTRKSVSAIMGGGEDCANGSAVITLERVKGRVCFRLNWSGIGTPVAAHIHDGLDGPAVVPLFIDRPKRTGCVKVPKALIRKITDSPGRYYVTVRTESSPCGALRGQL
jgi:hypothetical protein